MTSTAMGLIRLKAGHQLHSSGRRGRSNLFLSNRYPKAISELNEERSSVADYVEAHRALISPVRRLPLDMLQEIFVACLPTHRNCVMSASEAPVLLGRICSSWRTVVMQVFPLYTEALGSPPYRRAGSFGGDCQGLVGAFWPVPFVDIGRWKHATRPYPTPVLRHKPHSPDSYPIRIPLAGYLFGSQFANRGESLQHHRLRCTYSQDAEYQRIPRTVGAA
ncbi:hypothetical protein B0H14DRAFT_2958528 [Mycena olivaceomarginata]|nr:hypothetical protein B0H14DRAFT_2958528 [Mycena olivaceomarginata]